VVVVVLGGVGLTAVVGGGGSVAGDCVVSVTVGATAPIDVGLSVCSVERVVSGATGFGLSTFESPNAPMRATGVQQSPMKTAVTTKIVLCVLLSRAHQLGRGIGCVGWGGYVLMA
jgi:hypothetical protein